MGDISDNIPSVFPKCGPKTALKYFDNKELLDKKLAENEIYRNNYALNNKMVDFNNIPDDLVKEFIINNSCFHN